MYRPDFAQTVMLKLKEVKKTYKRKVCSSEVSALKDVSLELPDTGMVVVTGGKGAGKTTLLQLIGGQRAVTGGKIIGDCRNLREDTDGFRAASVSEVFADTDFVSHKTVRKILSDACGLLSIKPDDGISDKLLQTTGLSVLSLDERYETLPAEERRRAAVAVALIKEPAVIIADEPALPAGESGEILTLLKELSESRLVVLAAENDEAALKRADMIIRLKDGAVAEIIRTEKINAPTPQASYPQSQRPCARPVRLPSKRAALLALSNLGRSAALAAASFVMLLAVLSLFFTSFIYLNDSPAEKLAAALKEYPKAYLSLKKQAPAGFENPRLSKEFMDGLIERYPSLRFMPAAENISTEEGARYVERESGDGLDFICGRFPQNYGEAMIDKAYAETLLAKSDLDDYVELLDGGYLLEDSMFFQKTLSAPRRICGVVAGLPQGVCVKRGFFDAGRVETPAGFLSPVYIGSTYVQTGQSQKENVAFIKEFFDVTGDGTKSGRLKWGEDLYVLDTPLDKTLSEYDIVRHWNLGKSFLALAAVLAAPTYLLLFFFFRRSVRLNGRTNFEARVTGCGAGELLKTYLIQWAVLLGIALIAAAFIGVAALLGANSYFATAPLSPGNFRITLWNAAAVIGIGIPLTFLAALPPLIRLTRTPPAAIVRTGE